jgi:hypothetical protein
VTTAGIVVERVVQEALEDGVDVAELVFVAENLVADAKIVSKSGVNVGKRVFCVADAK